MKKIVIILFFLPLIIQAQMKDYSSFVNPFIGNGGHGHTFPGACVPYGMVQLSPDTRLSGWDGCSAYHFSDSIIYGFSHTHLSGTGCSDYGDILIMPVADINIYDTAAVTSEFSHKNENARAGYYSVLLSRGNIKAELTAGPRSGVHRYTFGRNKKNNGLFIDLEHRDIVLDASLEYISEYEIRGMRRSSAWAKNQVLYFVIRFSEPVKEYKIYNETRQGRKNIKAYLNFGKIKQITVKTGISACSYEGALLNLEADTKGKSFDDILASATSLWNDELGKIEVFDSDTNKLSVFYTALYHCMIAPNLYMDANGEYLGRDLKVHQAENFDYYTVFSLWDTYRAEHPLLTLIDKKRSNDFIQTFIKQYEQGGRLPVWELSANETDCMIGYHAVPVIVDAYMKGIRDYDAQTAFKAMKNSAEEDRAGLKFYREYGYIPGDKEHESVSKTLEYAYDDWCIALMAKQLNKSDDYRTYTIRSQFYKNVFDPETKFMRPRMNGAWLSPFDPTEVTFHYTEANAWQYSFYVPHDLNGLIKLFGSSEDFAERLDQLFNTSQELTGRKQADITGLIGQYAHGNEPSHHMAYLYNYIEEAWKTQEIVHNIVNNLYSAETDGLCGNEDCGQMSAWYVLSAMGFYQVCPGDLQFAFGTPSFSEIKLHTWNGNVFTLKAENLSNDAYYIQSVKLNGQEYHKSYIMFEDIIQGGTIEFVMGKNPNKTFGSASDDLPQSSVNDYLLLPSPFSSTGAATFSDSLTCSLGSISPDCEIYYTTDGSFPNPQSTKYEKPLVIKQTTTLSALATHPLLGHSYANISAYHKINPECSIQLLSEYSSQYTGGGNNALIDGLRGPSNFRLGSWQGYDSIDFEAIIDLGKVKPIQKISAGFLQDIGSWIWMPSEVIFYISINGHDFTEAGRISNNVPDNEYNVVINDFGISITAQARYIKVFAQNYGTIPLWHLGAGYTGWIFIDEIVIE